MPGEIFISYRRSDEAHARRLHALLKEQGVDAWYDAQVGAGQDWRQATAKALEASRIFVLLFSKAASESDDIAKELAAATYSKKLVIPVRLENIEPTGAFLYELASRNWINAWENTDARLGELAIALAGVVKDGAGAESLVQSGRGVSRAPNWKIKPVHLIAAAGLLAVATLSIAAVMQTGGKREAAAATPVQRIALFDLNAPPEDAAAAAMAEQTMSEIHETLLAVQLDTVARAETEGAQPGAQLDRASTLGALYAVGGSISRQDAKVSITTRVDDVPSRSTLWTRAVSAEGPDARHLPARAAAMTADILHCVANIRADLKRDEISVVSKLPAACLAIRAGGGTDVKRWRELVALAPESTYLNAMAGTSMGNTVDFVTPAMRDSVKADALAFIDEAIRLGPDYPETQIARIVAAGLRGEPLAAQEQVYLDGLRRAPTGANINAWYCWFLNDVGRSLESIEYCRAGLQGDPLSTPKSIGVAGVYSLLGMKAQADELFQLTHQRWPSRDLWHRRLAAAAIQDIGDIEALLKDPPSDLSADALACGRDVFSRLATAGAQDRRRISDAAQRCVKSGSLSPYTALMAYAWLGDMEPAYAEMQMMTYPNRLIFIPELAAFRKDPRFETEARRIGLVDYWRATGITPDFCAAEQAPVCATIGPSR